MRRTLKRFWCAALLATAACAVVNAQEDSLRHIENVHEQTLDSVVVIEKKRPSLPSRVMTSIENFFMGCDTNYVTPQKYNLTTQMELSLWHDYYFLRSSQTGNTMVIQSDPSVILGGYVYYSIFGYGAVWNLNDIGIKAGKTNGTSLRQSFVIHTAKIFAEYVQLWKGSGDSKRERN